MGALKIDGAVDTAAGSALPSMGAIIRAPLTLAFTRETASSGSVAGSGGVMGDRVRHRERAAPARQSILPRTIMPLTVFCLSPESRPRNGYRGHVHAREAQGRAVAIRGAGFTVPAIDIAADLAPGEGYFAVATAIPAIKAALRFSR